MKYFKLWLIRTGRATGVDNKGAFKKVGITKIYIKGEYMMGAMLQFLHEFYTGKIKTIAFNIGMLDSKDIFQMLKEEIQKV